MNCTTPTDFPQDFLTLSVTETDRGVACIDELYYAHVLLAYVCVAAGAFALICRLVNRLKPYHRYAGLVFMLVMYFVEGSAILIFNTGLPRAIIFFLSLMLFSMTIGFCIIRAHQLKFQKNVLKIADTLPLEKDEKISQLLNRARVEVLNTPRKWYQRLFSLKAAHGYLMAVAYYQMAGRAMVTNPFTSWEHCYVYPVYKELGSNGELVLLPGITEEEAHYQVTFALSITLPAVFTFALIGLAYVLGTEWWSRYKKNSLLTPKY